MNKTSQIISTSKNIKTTFNDNSLRPLCKEHLCEMEPYLRLYDRVELESTYALPALDGLEICLRKSSVAFAWYYEKKLCAVAGVSAETLLGRGACVWSFTSVHVEQYPKAFYRVSKQLLCYFKSIYPVLYAVCDQRYLQAKRYLKHLGAQVTGEPFSLAKKDTKFLLYLF